MKAEPILKTGSPDVIDLAALRKPTLHSSNLSRACDTLRAEMFRETVRIIRRHEIHLHSEGA
jgi:hypothetical protein